MWFSWQHLKTITDSVALSAVWLPALGSLFPLSSSPSLLVYLFFFFFFVELLPRLLWPSPNLKHSYSSIRLSGSAFALMHVSRSLLKPISPHLTKSALFHCKSSYCTAPPPTCISMCLCLVPKHFPINLHQPVSHFLKLLFKSFSRFPLLPDKYSVEHFVFFLCFSKRRCTLMSRTIPQTDGAMPK